MATRRGAPDQDPSPQDPSGQGPSPSGPSPSDPSQQGPSRPGDAQPGAGASSGGLRPDRVARAYTPSALPSVTARALAFIAILLGGLCGGLIGYAITDLQCGTPEVTVETGPDGQPVPGAVVPERDPDDAAGCRTLAAVGGLVGAAAAAGGVAVVSVLVLRAMAEWRRELEIDEDGDQADELVDPARARGSSR